MAVPVVVEVKSVCFTGAACRVLLKRGDDRVVVAVQPMGAPAKNVARPMRFASGDRRNVTFVCQRIVGDSAIAARYEDVLSVPLELGETQDAGDVLEGAVRLQEPGQTYATVSYRYYAPQDSGCRFSHFRAGRIPTLEGYVVIINSDNGASCANDEALLATTVVAGGMVFNANVQVFRNHCGSGSWPRYPTLRCAACNNKLPVVPSFNLQESNLLLDKSLELPWSTKVKCMVLALMNDGTAEGFVINQQSVSGEVLAGRIMWLSEIFQYGLVLLLHCMSRSLAVATAKGLGGLGAKGVLLVYITDEDDDSLTKGFFDAKRYAVRGLPSSVDCGPAVSLSTPAVVDLVSCLSAAAHDATIGAVLEQYREKSCCAFRVGWVRVGSFDMDLPASDFFGRPVPALAEMIKDLGFDRIDQPVAEADVSEWALLSKDVVAVGGSDGDVPQPTGREIWAEMLRLVRSVQESAPALDPIEALRISGTLAASKYSELVKALLWKFQPSGGRAALVDMLEPAVRGFNDTQLRDLVTAIRATVWPPVEKAAPLFEGADCPSDAVSH